MRWIDAYKQRMRLMADKSRMNGLGLSGSTKAAGGSVELTTNLGNLGATVQPIKPSNNPGPMTSPQAQAAEPPKAKPSKTTKVNVPKD